MVQRKSDIFFSALVAGALLICLMFIDAAVSQRVDRDFVRERCEIVRVLTLTDLCLFTEARYTRHPSMADLHTPFQDHPLALEHFPSGAIMAVPPQLKPMAMTFQGRISDSQEQQ
ncbi:MAG: hypothetical protein Q7U88_00685 [Desulfocapsaceae bacterium]|nr:hypothetical protein [Desulfocapsaceae bacterium]